MSKIIPHPEGLLAYGHVLNGPGAGAALSVAEAPAVLQSDTLAWVHLHAQHPEAAAWILRSLSYLDPNAVEALLAEETRPRATRFGEGLVLILRGINTIAGEDPEDMVSVRLWIDPRRIVSLSMRQVRAVEDISEELVQGRGPREPAQFLVRLAERLNLRIEDFWTELEEEADRIEEEILLEDLPEDLRARLVALRRRSVILRRHLAPQRDALRALQAAPPPWLEQDDLRELTEEQDALERVVEDADAMRDRMALVRDELQGKQDERLNRNLYLLSILSAVFLPLGFLTGLFGINTGGLPGASSPWAFWVFCAAMVVIGAGQLWVLRRLRWI
jgi:zinc transporter